MCLKATLNFGVPRSGRTAIVHVDAMSRSCYLLIVNKAESCCEMDHIEHAAYLRLLLLPLTIGAAPMHSGGRQRNIEITEHDMAETFMDVPVETFRLFAQYVAEHNLLGRGRTGS
jgi:hypothetical protein